MQIGTIIVFFETIDRAERAFNALDALEGASVATLVKSSSRCIKSRHLTAHRFADLASIRLAPKARSRKSRAQGWRQESAQQEPFVRTVASTSTSVSVTNRPFNWQC